MIKLFGRKRGKKPVVGKMLGCFRRVLGRVIQNVNQELLDFTERKTMLALKTALKLFQRSGESIRRLGLGERRVVSRHCACGAQAGRQLMAGCNTLPCGGCSSCLPSLPVCGALGGLERAAREASGEEDSLCAPLVWCNLPAGPLAASLHPCGHDAPGADVTEPSSSLPAVSPHAGAILRYGDMVWLSYLRPIGIGSIQ